MFGEIVAETLEGVELVNVDICVLLMAEKFDLLAVTKVRMSIANESVLSPVDQILDLPVKLLERKPGKRSFSP